MTKEFREMQLNNEFQEVLYLFRISNVRKDCIGYNPLLIATMTYLKDPSLKFSLLVWNACVKSPEAGFINLKACFDVMKIALQDLCTGHPNKVLDNHVDFTFIKNITSEVRMRELIKMRALNNDLKIDEETTSIVVRLAIRKIMKPEDNFSEVLNHTSGKMGYADAKELLYKTYPVVADIDIKSVIEKVTKDIKNSREKAIKQRELLRPYSKEVEDIVNDLIENHLNLHF